MRRDDRNLSILVAIRGDIRAASRLAIIEVRAGIPAADHGDEPASAGPLRHCASVVPASIDSASPIA